ncbi:alpha/beta fold hydrolase [Gemmatimonas groenlandica]|uniref:Alpha/beta hydrolase n=1 Tax=Gemmatimonas groenlandica TaxID=2732249 RepID=A0A6M4IP83_9BACT|nr:alpha/beta hydrolase [Gemmatimonas groenlandica]QJR35825.1 alpha/beta hydrolase [Gemmatimonas groenlandica]
MRRFARYTLIGLVLLLVGLTGYGAWKNPEKGPLDAAARTGVPGQFVALSGGVTHYDIAGPDTGRVVVLVHGFSVPSYIWDSTSTALSAAGYRVIRYDLFGRGWSDRPDAAYDGAMYDAQLNDLLDSLRITQPVDLVGLSFGGFVTSHYVAGHAARVRTFTMIDPVSSARVLPGFLSWPVVGPWVWQTTQVPGMADGQASDFLHPAQYPTWVDQYRPQMRYKGFGRALLRSAVTMSRTDFGALFASAAKAGVPTLLVWGKQDQTVPIGLSEVARTNMPQLEFFPVDSAGHLPHIEQSVLVHAKMQEFFRAHPAK